ncbi:hypothetical protein MW887_011235 [Aspergillus wentii]|nr:hypothetical protein MW887_011235 [Aspergillus wentii]
MAGVAPTKQAIKEPSRSPPDESQLYIRQLQSNPLRTKMLTSGVLSALQEFLASWIAHDVSKHGHYFSPRVPKMALYGMFVSAPLGHFLIGILQKIFAGRTSIKAKILQIIASNLVVCLFFFPLVLSDTSLLRIC